MEESIFEQIDERTVSLWINVAAVAFPLLTLAIGAAVCRLTGRPGRGLALGVLIGLMGPIVCLYWHLYDARTSYHDWLYLKHNQEKTYVRFFWIGQPTDEARAKAQERENAGEKGVIIVEGTFRPSRLWQFVQPYPLYSVRGLGMFALATLAGAVVLGVGTGLALRSIDTRWPPPPEDKPEPGEEPSGPSDEAPAGEPDNGKGSNAEADAAEPDDA